MKKIGLMLLFLFVGSVAMSQGIEFRTMAYNEALKQAKKENKLIFIDVYTSWCGPCRHMATKIFTEAAAGEYYNTHFICLKLDAEKSADGKKVAADFTVTAYPTCLFINGNGELVYRFLGGRSVEELVGEGEKARQAFERFPQLKTMEKKYNKGNRETAFLDEYANLRESAGLDAGRILVEYFTQLPDSVLLNDTNRERIARITVFDPTLAQRIVKRACEQAPTADKKQKSQIHKAVTGMLGGVIRDIMDRNADDQFEELLSLKNQFFTATGAGESVTAAAMGGGQICMPSDMIRLDYYNYRKNGTEFTRIFERMVQKSVNPEKRNSAEEIDRMLKEKMDSIKQHGTEEEYTTMKKMSSMLLAMSTIDIMYTNSTLIENIERYEGYYSGTKDQAYEDRIADWYVTLNRMTPSVKNALYAADKLIEKGRKAQAREILELALEKGQKAAGVEPQHIDECKAKIESLK